MGIPEPASSFESAIHVKQQAQNPPTLETLPFEMVMLLSPVT